MARIVSEPGMPFPQHRPAQLASTAEPAGKRKGTNATGKGNRYLARTLGEAVIAAARIDTFLGERYRRLARRRGKKKAIVAVGRPILWLRTARWVPARVP